jgi:hypothetical protein
VRTSAGEPLISKRPFAPTKCSSWLVSKQSPRLLGFKGSYTKSATVSYATSCRRHLTDRRTKTLELQNPVPKTIRKTKQRCRNVWIWSLVWGVQLVANEPQPEPRYYTEYWHCAKSEGPVDAAPNKTAYRRTAGAGPLPAACTRNCSNVDTLPAAVYERPYRASELTCFQELLSSKPAATPPFRHSTSNFVLASSLFATVE